MDGVGEPHVAVQPSELVNNIERAPAKARQAIAFLRDRLREVGVQPQTKPAGERGRLSHELRADRKRAARRHHDGDPVTVVQPGHHRLGRREDRVGALDDVVRRQAPGALAEVHRTTGKVESNANGSSCRRDGVEDRVVAMRHDIVVVGDRRRPAQRQLGQADRCRYANVLDRNTRPDRVELLEPREQVAAGGTPRVSHWYRWWWVLTRPAVTMPPSQAITSSPDLGAIAPISVITPDRKSVV